MYITYCCRLLACGCVALACVALPLACVAPACLRCASLRCPSPSRATTPLLAFHDAETHAAPPREDPSFVLGSPPSEDSLSLNDCGYPPEGPHDCGIIFPRDCGIIFPRDPIPASPPRPRSTHIPGCSRNRRRAGQRGTRRRSSRRRRSRAPKVRWSGRRDAASSLRCIRAGRLGGCEAPRRERGGWSGVWRGAWFGRPAAHSP